MGDIIRTESAEIIRKTGADVAEMARAMQAMADMLRATNERMAALESCVRTLEKVSPEQAAMINRRIRQRAAELCADYRMPGREKILAAAIRKEIRSVTGARSAREIARCDCRTVTESIDSWEDVATIRRLRKKGDGHAEDQE